ncbi:Glucan endo-1,3-beta-glucosidase [Gossypium australe]|uniref:Glucan endo-1,3-beta-glucosidase n=1 Tax=Gossypium australe TaxID=47621 RepID=A0A5B6V021_9ROSI|nr:Glucan endo-1,3-beta-glucosidase [Gossypium australe]
MQMQEDMVMGETPTRRTEISQSTGSEKGIESVDLRIDMDHDLSNLIDHTDWTIKLASSGGKNTWCIAKPSTENFRLNGNINYSCSQKGVDRKPIQPGGTCYRPNTIISHASYAMNLFYKVAGKNSWNCHFNGTGIIISENPCKFIFPPTILLYLFSI